MKTMIGEFFALEDFSVSSSHPDLVEPVPDAYLVSVKQLVKYTLDPLRRILNRPIVILSGYRSPALNVAVGGSQTSQHLRAQAVDIRTDRVRDVFRSMYLRPNHFPTGQVIYYPKQNFIHIALPSTKYPNPTFFVSTAGKTYDLVESVKELNKLVPVK